MRYLQFVLTMPNRGSWNGQWSGANNFYAITRTFSNKSKFASETLPKILGDNHYHWSDGWGANVNVTEVDAKQAAQSHKRSQGFCGYGWMVDSLLQYGKIFADHQKPTDKETESPLPLSEAEPA